MRAFGAWICAATLCLWGLMAQASPEIWQYQWPNTDFETTSLESWQEIQSGGPGRDGIPALDAPQFIRANQADIAPREPVVTVEIVGAEPRA